MGCVLQAGNGMNVARQAGLKAGLPVEVPGETVNRVCGSGLQAVVHAVEAIRVGYVDAIVAGGTESMSNAPYLLKGARWGYRMGNGEVDRLDAARGADVRDRPDAHGHHRRRGGDALQRVARGSGRVRRREPGARGARDCRRTLQGRDRAGAGPAAQRRSGPGRHRRVSARGDDGGEARRAEAGVQEGRHGDRRQRVRDQRRRRRARRHDGARRRRRSARSRWRASWRTCRPASIRR